MIITALVGPLISFVFQVKSFLGCITSVVPNPTFGGLAGAAVVGAAAGAAIDHNAIMEELGAVNEEGKATRDLAGGSSGSLQRRSNSPQQHPVPQTKDVNLGAGPLHQGMEGSGAEARTSTQTSAGTSIPDPMPWYPNGMSQGPSLPFAVPVRGVPGSLLGAVVYPVQPAHYTRPYDPLAPLDA